MKKIAFYVEGQTEQFFINKLLIEIAGQKNIQIELQQFQGIGKAKRTIYPKSTANPQNPQHFALIFDCMGDGGVKPRIIEDASSLLAQGYSEVIGLRDLYPLTDITRFEDELINGTIRKGRRITPALPNDTSIVIAIREIEDWFIAECNHYSHIDASLTLNSGQITSIGFNPQTDDLTTRSNAAAEDLRTIYQLVNKTYNKSKDKVERTVECLDYCNIYLNTKYRFLKLQELIDKIDRFLS
ncbi:DUF4276 family protein [Alistipes sp. ZOR0009]|uniref:DUF4276 family protein n=1 Tax=Alistipes sp. ZOR0009 TaxID=1339253 RepID=UPI00068A6110|nr:DUF4276 family protein [Alistipes sp. ZOR0009]